MSTPAPWMDAQSRGEAQEQRGRGGWVCRGACREVRESDEHNRPNRSFCGMRQSHPNSSLEGQSVSGGGQDRPISGGHGGRGVEGHCVVVCRGSVEHGPGATAQVPHEMLCL